MVTQYGSKAKPLRRGFVPTEPSVNGYHAIMYRILQFEARWDVDNHAGVIRAQLEGTNQPLNLPPLGADEFTAIYTLLSSSKGAAWDGQSKSIVAQVDQVG